MKIGSQTVPSKLSQLEGTQADALSQNRGKSKAGQADPTNLQASSNVTVSERAMAMQKAKEIASSDDIDEAKVARLQKMIDQGEYKVDAGAVADRLVDQHLLFPE